MALAVDALVAAHYAHRELPVPAREPSSSRPSAAIVDRSPTVQASVVLVGFIAVKR